MCSRLALRDDDDDLNTPIRRLPCVLRARGRVRLGLRPDERLCLRHVEGLLEVAATLLVYVREIVRSE